ncbi:Subtilisin-like protease [Smittium mucronatum]|uniref:Subtilisin-like protease n=1 Tax=Smittium mucronatum TaxID=133383 RepID=A0A1R0GR01_9FUNG|nr:Subtilisin-like protease [Smittium mucronatum]
MKLFIFIFIFFISSIYSEDRGFCDDPFIQKLSNGTSTAFGKEKTGYIVTLKPDTDAVKNSQELESHIEWLNKVLSSSTNPCQVSGNNQIRNFTIGTFFGYSAMLDLETVSKVCNRAEVAFVEKDQMVTLDG